MSALSQQLVLKEGNVFLLSHETGDLSGNIGLGLYYRDVRYLSHFLFKVNGAAPPLLNFSGYRNFMGTLQFGNDFLGLPDGTIVLPQTLSIRRSRFISNGLHERIGLANYNRFPVPLEVTLEFGSDFRDIFDIRGFSRDTWGEQLPPSWEDGKLTLRYCGLDGVERSTWITFDRPPDEVDFRMPTSTEPRIEVGIMLPVVGAASRHVIIEPPVVALTWRLTLDPDVPTSFAMHVMPHDSAEEGQGKGNGYEQQPINYAYAADSHRSETTPSERSDANSQQGNGPFDRAVDAMRHRYRTWDQESTILVTDNEDLNALLKRCRYDLRVLSEPAEGGYFPSAGIPWYACPFGRDSLITALQTLMLNPLLAVGTLHTLARYQGTKEDPWREEQPGKILHEMRFGEMARLGLVPHSPYYGTVDATPLFVMLFVETMRWLDDDNLYKALLPNVMRAVEWIDRYGDVDGDGFVEYAASTSHTGIRNQVWKDSLDSMQFPDGTLAETPVAAVEVQGYVYAAKLGLSELLRRKGDIETANRLRAEAEVLRERFNEAFWMPEAGFFCQGLDKDKRQVPTITSNPGHCLWCGIVDDEKAAQVVKRLTQPDMFCGWGIRTIGTQEPSYNPMSYHNGSIWPHDNSIIVAGFKRYGFHDEANAIVSEILEAAQHFLYARLPELYCGFKRDTVYQSGPAEYPVSCSPQAWAAGAPILMLQSLLGLQPDAADGYVRASPRVPDWLNSVRVSNLRVGNARVEILVNKEEGRTEVSMSNSDGDLALEVS
jgi:glycogen debranching enzyme